MRRQTTQHEPEMVAKRPEDRQQTTKMQTNRRGRKTENRKQHDWLRPERGDGETLEHERTEGIADAKQTQEYIVE